MAGASKQRPIHLIKIYYGNECKAVCDSYIEPEPIEAIIKRRVTRNIAKGTFDPIKVTCKRCLKHPDYKTAMDKIRYPLFFLGK